MSPTPATVTVAIRTLGCKLNQFEGEQLREAFEALGYVIVPYGSRADVYVVNSCTVTSATDRDCRRLARQARRANPEALVVVTGCYAQGAPEAVEALPEVDLVVSNEAKGSLAGLVRERLVGSTAHQAARPAPAVAAPVSGAAIGSFRDHTRAFVKVQEGCDAACTYCIVPRVRGRSRSLSADAVREQVERLVAAGHPELVLMGTHLGRYGADLGEGHDLTWLVHQLAETPGLGRLRLSSVEPAEVTPSLVELVAHHPRVCRHLHVPLQSGCDAVLSRMRRPYRARDFATLVMGAKSLEPGVCIGSDVMVGFPGETPAEYAETWHLLAALPVSYLHVFCYSQRAQTPAASMPGQVSPEAKRERSRGLRALSDQKRIAFAEEQQSAVTEIAVEGVVAGRGGWVEGTTDNYLRAHLRGDEGLVGSLQRGHVVAVRAGTLEVAQPGHRADQRPRPGCRCQARAVVVQ
jgi:threonylcarbamoyladenosine tRNA methylthiotransferase MtaB